MATADDQAEFTFSWRALELLGKGLYSNPWSALSELVANGLDAGAQNVYVYIDARDKAHATVEVIDDGTGMSRVDIDTYVKVGYNRRSAATDDDSKPKGRKGIGKLAALFLSQHFYLQTLHEGATTAWELDAREGTVNADDHPRLLAVRGGPATSNDTLWSTLSSGTRLILLDVDLTGYGAQAVSALGSRLANQFLLPDDGLPRIQLCVQTSDTAGEPQYEPVKKSVAFGNLAYVAQYFPDLSVRPPELSGEPYTVVIPATGLPGGSYEHVASPAPFPANAPEDEVWAAIRDDVDREQNRYLGVPYSLTGWIGVHGTIDSEAARDNDERFIKNKYYNPAQIRVYVRGKLASDRLLTQLGLTGTYTNYIEGELSFDLLDEDALPDIATSNRQDFDETDGRVALLRALVRPIVRSLMQDRQALATEINGLVDAEKARRESASKRNFAKQVRADLDHHDEISDEARDELETRITAKIQGDVSPKQTYRVFISHARADKAFASFIDDVLQKKGARPEEIFFTSRTGNVLQQLDERALGDIIKQSIIDANTLLFFLTSKNFLVSEFCLFEGGAGWATRAVHEYLKLNMDYESIPKFLTNGKSEMTILSGSDAIELTLDLHNYLVLGVFNPMIHHLNCGREIAGEPLLEVFELQDVPTAVELASLGKTPLDYCDRTIIDHWDVIVGPSIPDYLTVYLQSGGTDSN